MPETATAKVFVLVQDFEHHVIDGAAVEGRHAGETFRPIPFVKTLQRSMLDEQKPGSFEIRVHGVAGLTEEDRTVNLEPGDNHIQVMLGKPGMPSFDAAGMKCYFTPRPDAVLLAVRGSNAANVTAEMLGKHKLDFRRVTGSKETAPPDNALFEIQIGEGEEATDRLKVLNAMLGAELAKSRVTGRLAAPAYQEGEPAFGIPNEIVARFQPWMKRDEIRRLAEKYDLTIVREVTYLGNVFLLRSKLGGDYQVLDIIHHLMGEPGVAYVEPNLIHRLTKNLHTPNDYLFPETPHLHLIHCDDAWDTLAGIPGGNAGGSPNVTIAVLDLEGVDPGHHDLTGTLSDSTQKMVIDWDFVNGNNQTFANVPGDHGTQCAGSATADMDNNVGISGVAPNCHLVGGRMDSSPSQLDIADYWAWMAGFDIGAAPLPQKLPKGADIISNSWGFNAATSMSSVWRDVLDFVTSFGRNGRGTILCFSTGNLGYILVDNFNPFSSYPKTIGVGASINQNPTNPCNSVQPDPNGNYNNLAAAVDTRAYYSPYGLTIDLVAPSHTCYDGSLPGAQIRDPIMSTVRTNMGDWPGSASATTALTQAAAAGATSVNVGNTSGFSVGEYALFNKPGGSPSETHQISAVSPGHLTVSALGHAYGANTAVVTGPNNDYAKNASVGFGGTSHACPTVAGAAALLLSVKPDLTWVEVRDILRSSAAKIDAAQANTIGQWQDLDGDGAIDYSQWYGYGRLDVNAAVQATVGLVQRTDAVVRDDLTDNGSVPSTGWHANSPDIWVRNTDDPIPTTLAYTSPGPHQNPKSGQDNWVYLRVRNVGTRACSTLYLRASVAHFGGVEFQYPKDWEPTAQFGQTPATPLQPGTYLIGEQIVADLPPGGDAIVKMKWDQNLIPPEEVMVDGTSVHWHPCLLAEVSPHDGPAPVADAYPVRGDNNIAQKNITIDYPPSGASSATSYSAVIVGSRLPKGIEAVIVDRSRVPREYVVVVRAPDGATMERWTGLAKSGELRACKPLGVTPPGLIRTRVDVTVGSRDGHSVLVVGAGTQAFELPLRLNGDAYRPVLVGLERTGETRSKAETRLSQRRADGAISAGYTILT